MQWSHVRTLLVRRPFQFQNRHSHTVGKQRNTLGKLLSKSSATCALPYILSEKALIGARRKGSLLFRASLVTLSRLPKVLTKMIAKCSENGHPEPSGFTEPVGRAWILWNSLGTLGFAHPDRITSAMFTVDRGKVQQVRTILGKQEVLRNICIATSATEMGACLQ